MKKKYYVLIALIIVVVVFLIIESNKTRIEPFNAKPGACSEISNSMSLLSNIQKKTVYKTKITVFKDYSPNKHRESYPEDIAIRTWHGDRNIVVILTNNNVTDDNNYLVKD